MVNNDTFYLDRIFSINYIKDEKNLELYIFKSRNKN